jgi:hypothetical protein
MNHESIDRYEIYLDGLYLPTTIQPLFSIFQII